MTDVPAPATVSYFAIGSMMNDQNLRFRDLVPSWSAPAIIFDFKFVFFARRALGTAMAGALHEPGASFHGVLHELPVAHMDALDAIEHSYDRTPCRVRLYDGTERDAVVYVVSADPAFGPIEFHKLPSQRYIDVLVAGARSHGVDEDYIAQLAATPCQPRKAVSELLAFPVPEGVPMWTREYAASCNGMEGRPLALAFNGKVITLRPEAAPAAASHFRFLKARAQSGDSFETVASRLLYDVKYGVFDRVAQCTREFCAVIEDFVASGDANGDFVVIARIPQVYSD